MQLEWRQGGEVDRSEGVGGDVDLDDGEVVADEDGVAAVHVHVQADDLRFGPPNRRRQLHNPCNLME